MNGLDESDKHMLSGPNLSQFSPETTVSVTKSKPFSKRSPFGISNVSLADTTNNKALYLKGIDPKKVQVQMLYNIFSNFGNIESIILNKKRGTALLTFENAEFASNAKDNLNSLNFFGSPLKVPT